MQCSAGHAVLGWASVQEMSADADLLVLPGYSRTKSVRRGSFGCCLAFLRR
jgi:hypothetical protein